MTAWEPGEAVGDYLLDQVLGRGGMGVVFRARHQETGAICAIKALTLNDPKEAERFEREGEALARLRHPNLLGVHSAGWHAGRPYLVLEHAPQGDLARRLLDGRRLPWQDAVEWARQLAGGLASAHRVGVVHRDIKPENVLFGGDGRPLLADFGLAKLSDRTLLTQTGALMGTPLYMAPEQARGEDSGGAADVYSLGAVLFRCVSGRTPIACRDNPMSQLLALQEESPPPLRELVDVPRWLEALAAEALTRDPVARPSAQEFERRLTLGGNGAPSRAGPGPWAVAVGLVGPVGLVGLVALGAVGLGVLDQGEPRATPSVPSLSGQGASPSNEPATSPKGAFVVSSPVLSEPIALGLGWENSLVSTTDEALGDLLRARRVGLGTRGEELNAWIELGKRGYVDYVAKLLTSKRKPSAPELNLLRTLGDYGHRASLTLMGNRKAYIQKRPHKANAYAVLGIRLNLLIPRAPLLEAKLRELNQEADLARRAHPIPRTVGAAWAVVWRDKRATTRSWVKARSALNLTPAQALAAYLQAWRSKGRGPTELAIELQRVAEWSWLGCLAALDYPQGFAERRPGTTAESLREQADDLLGEIEWARGRYLRAVMEAPSVDFYVPESPLPAAVCRAMLPHLDRALLLDRGDVPTYLLRARVHHALGNAQAAVTDLRTVRHVTPFDVNRSAPLSAFYLLELCKERGKISDECRDAVLFAELIGPEDEWRKRVVVPRYQALGGE